MKFQRRKIFLRFRWKKKKKKKQTEIKKKKKRTVRFGITFRDQTRHGNEARPFILSPIARTLFRRVSVNMLALGDRSTFYYNLYIRTARDRSNWLVVELYRDAKISTFHRGGSKNRGEYRKETANRGGKKKANLQSSLQKNRSELMVPSHCIWEIFW